MTWDFADFPGRFPVEVVEASPPHRVVIRWGGKNTASEDGHTTTTFEFESVDEARTLLTITESAWQPTIGGAKNAFDNCEGWTHMLVALEAWIEHAINLREGFYK